jgi:choline kinase
MTQRELLYDSLKEIKEKGCKGVVFVTGHNDKLGESDIMLTVKVIFGACRY